MICCVAQVSFAQADSVTVTIQSQYETAVKESGIIVVSSGEKFVTAKKGHVTVRAAANDLIKVDNPNYDSTAVPLSKISKDGVLKIHKNFSWVDLITPMFYIVNGGLWLILFIIFAETGLFAGFFFPGDSLLLDRKSVV